MRPVGRASELAELTSALFGPHPSAVMIEGPQGIGKTTLWQVLLGQAEERGWHVLSARCSESEADLPFGALADLLAAVDDSGMASLPPPRARNLRIALRLEEPAGRPPDRLGLGLAILSLLEAMGSRERPVVVAVDDLQWMDVESLGTLRFAVRRVGGGHFRFVFTRRVSDRASDDAGPPGALAEIGRHCVAVGLSGLADSSLYEVIHEQLAMNVSPATLAELARLTQGNPMFALELARAARDGAIRFTPGEPARLPDSLRSAVTARLRRLPAERRHVLAFAAALAAPTRHVLCQVTHDPDSVDAALAAAEEAGLTAWHGDEITFSHPLLRSGILSFLRPGERRRLHKQLASVLPPGEARAFHLAAATIEPDEEVARELQRAAAEAADRGAQATAAEMFERAYRLSETDHGGPALRRLLAAADCAQLAGDGERLTRLVGEALKLGCSGPDLGEVLLRAANIQPTIDQTVTTLEHAIAEAGNDPHLRARLHQAMGGALFVSGDHQAARRYSHLAVDEALLTEDPELIVPTVGSTVTLEVIGGRLPSGEAVDEAIRLEPRAKRCPSYYLPSFWMGLHLFCRGDLERARPMAEGALERARRYDDPAGVLMHIAELEVGSGHFLLGLERAKESLLLNQQAEWPQVGGSLYAVALAEARLGLVDEAAAHARQGLEASRAIGDVAFESQNLQVLAFIGLSIDEPGETMRWVEPLPALVSRLGVREPFLRPAYADAVEAALMLGMTDSARSFEEELHAVSEELDHPWGLAVSARGRALIAAAEGRWDDSLLLSEEAVSLLRALPMPFDTARALLVAGQVNRRARRKKPARDALEESANLFDELGSPLWRDKAHRELSRIGGRPPSPVALTATEAQVAALAAGGVTNREIAARLFVSTSTVETNLTRAYRKLGVRSRGQLAGALKRGLPH